VNERSVFDQLESLMQLFPYPLVTIAACPLRIEPPVLWSFLQQRGYLSFPPKSRILLIQSDAVTLRLKTPFTDASNHSRMTPRVQTACRHAMSRFSEFRATGRNSIAH
jgi:hypothetical protein